MYMRQIGLKAVIEELLPEGEIASLGSKYLMVAMNFFRNDYLREVLQKRPEYNSVLRAYIGDEDGDIRTAKIDTKTTDMVR